VGFPTQRGVGGANLVLSPTDANIGVRVDYEGAVGRARGSVDELVRILPNCYGRQCEEGP